MSDKELGYTIMKRIAYLKAMDVFTVDWTDVLSLSCLVTFDLGGGNDTTLFSWGGGLGTVDGDSVYAHIQKLKD
jgi:hypothetical protein